MKNVWILTEERPKKDVIRSLIQVLASKIDKPIFIDLIRIVPEMKEGEFTFRYKILGCTANWVDTIYLQTVSGTTSFVDFLLYYQNEEPSNLDKPLFVVEETKTSDNESRNTGVYQRATKFVFIETIYQGVDKIMYYASDRPNESRSTETNQFGTNCLLTLGIKFIGKNVDEVFSPFRTIDELIEFKGSMRRPPKGNIPIDITKVSENLITISGRLVKSGRLSHDPNIGALSLISATLRKLGYTGTIRVILHGLSQGMLNGRNKFVRVCNLYQIELDGLILPESPDTDIYWYFEKSSEKLVTIFLHLMLEEFSNSKSIYENHAGCERGYFYQPNGSYLAVKKYTNRELYKSGDKSAIYALPDLVIQYPEEKKIYNIEGEKSENVSKGIVQLDGFTAFETSYVNKYYPGYRVIRTVVIYGHLSKPETYYEVSFVLTETGKIILTTTSPKLFIETVSNLKSFWA